MASLHLSDPTAEGWLLLIPQPALHTLRVSSHIDLGNRASFHLIGWLPDLRVSSPSPDHSLRLARYTLLFSVSVLPTPDTLGALTVEDNTLQY